MPNFGRKSSRNLLQCHPYLVRLFQEVVKTFDCSIIVGHRGEAEQNMAYLQEKSTKDWPHSKHNQEPSLAVDVVPWPFNENDWGDKERFYFMAGHVLGIAGQLGIDIRWGGDWDRDKDIHDQKFDDLVHFELRG